MADSNKPKTVLFLGSSVTYGSSSGGWSMCEYVAENSSYEVIKLAVSGTTLADINEGSYLNRLRESLHELPRIDHLIVQLSTNDPYFGVETGEVTDSTDPMDQDPRTSVGAMEHIIRIAREDLGCPITFYIGAYFDRSDYAVLVDALMRLQLKHGFDIIDLYHDKAFNDVSPEDYALYMTDPVHPTRLGYEKWWGPKFLEYLERVL